MEKTRKTTWYENDLFWKTFGSQMFTAERLAAAATETNQMTELLKLQAGDKVLDLCCGVGRHSLELARRGYEVTAVDRTASYLDQARNKAKTEGLAVDFVQDDMRRFCALEEFDAVINVFTAFGYFKEPCDDKRVLLNVYASLKNGGKLLLELIGKEVLARIFRQRDWYENNGTIFLRETEVTQDWSWAENRWILLENGKRKEFRFGHRVYSAVELNSLLRQYGFRNVEVYGNLDGAPYNHEAQRLVVAAFK